MFSKSPCFEFGGHAHPSAAQSSLVNRISLAALDIGLDGTGSGFKQGRDFAAWLGLVPQQESTGDRTKLGRISKRG
jgi:transposase